MTDNEKWYDEHVAPELLRLANECGDRGLSFFAFVKYGPEEYARTIRVTGGDINMQMVNHCAKTAPNVDSYLIGLKRFCAEHGIDTSGSIFLSSVGSK